MSDGQLHALVERIERLEEEKRSTAEDIKEVYAEAKGTGYDTKVLKEVIKLRSKDKNERQEHDSILEAYLSALGMS
jgi:uncharacterized protein (UPF0335 family)